MKDSNITSSRNELLFVIIFALISTLVMAYLGAFKRLYLFTLSFYSTYFGEFAVFFPAFLALGFTYFSYRRIRDLESEINKRKQAEEALLASEEKYKGLSITDELTQLYNSRHFFHLLILQRNFFIDRHPQNVYDAD